MEQVIEINKSFEEALKNNSSIPSTDNKLNLTQLEKDPQNKTAITIYKTLQFINDVRKNNTINHNNYRFLLAQYDELDFGDNNDEMSKAAKRLAEAYLDVAYIKCNATPKGALYNLKSITTEDTTNLEDQSRYVWSSTPIHWMKPQGPFVQISEFVSNASNRLEYIHLLFNNLNPEIEKDIDEAIALGEKYWGRTEDLHFLQHGILDLRDEKKTEHDLDSKKPGWWSKPIFKDMPELNIGNFESKIEATIDKKLNNILLPENEGPYIEEDKKVFENFSNKYKPSFIIEGKQHFCNHIIEDALKLAKEKAVFNPEEQRIIDMAKRLPEYIKDKDWLPKEQKTSFGEKVKKIDQELENTKEIQQKINKQKDKKPETVLDLLKPFNPEKAKDLLNNLINNEPDNKNKTLLEETLKKYTEKPKKTTGLEPYQAAAIAFVAGVLTTGLTILSAFIIDKTVLPQNFPSEGFMRSLMENARKYSTTILNNIDKVIAAGLFISIAAAVTTTLLLTFLPKEELTKG